MAFSARTRLGRYEVVALIGAGGIGEVYRATDIKLKPEVALKVLPEASIVIPRAWCCSNGGPKCRRR
jgi:serine/threonine protein kinase